MEIILCEKIQHLIKALTGEIPVCREDGTFTTRFIEKRSETIQLYPGGLDTVGEPLHDPSPTQLRSCKIGGKTSGHR